PLRQAIEQANAEGMLEIADDFRNRGLGDAEMRGGFRHAAALNHRDEHVQVAQLEPASDLAFPGDLLDHGCSTDTRRRAQSKAASKCPAGPVSRFRSSPAFAAPLHANLGFGALGLTAGRGPPFRWNG